MLLAIDTSTSTASIALVQERHVLAELTWDVGQRHSVELFERLQWLLAHAGSTPSAVDAVAVALGPGSFNGVRVALATAKALTFSLQAPLYGHPTLDIAAWGHAAADREIVTVLEAGRGQLYAARYAPATAPADWAPINGYHVLTPAELAAQVAHPSLIVGEMRPATHDALAGLLGDNARFASPLAPRRATWLAELALARSAPDDPMTIEPLYLRRPAITTSTRASLGLPAQPPASDVAPSGEEAASALSR